MPFMVFPYTFSAATPVFFSDLKHDFFLSVRYKIFTTDGPWIEVCQNAVFSKMDITMTTINKIQGHNLRSRQHSLWPKTFSYGVVTVTVGIWQAKWLNCSGVAAYGILLRYSDAN